MSSREQILGRLRQRKERPFPTSEPAPTHRAVVPPGDQSPVAWRARFIDEAQKAGCIVHEADSPEAAIAVILEIVGEDTAVSAWDPAHIPLLGLGKALDKANIKRVEQDAGVRVGLTGVDAALAATGSVVVVSGNGRARTASLLPPIHIAVVTASQIMPDLESWWAAQKAAGWEQIRRHSNVVVITGPSRTADIAMQLVMGMHGPRNLHLVLLADS
ncbi:MAG: lactate utilization protein [Chloroflexota bacterium]